MTGSETYAVEHAIVLGSTEIVLAEDLSESVLEAVPV